MPHLVFYNLNPTDLQNVEEIEKAVSQTLISIKDLGLSMEDISYSFFKDETVESETIPVVIIVELLFEKEDRSYGVRCQTATAIGQAFEKTIIKWRKKLPKTLEVAVKRFNPKKDGFWSKRSAT
jgi:hypothetical protein